VKPGLLILPFLAVLIAALGLAVGSSIPEIKWVSIVGTLMSGGILVLWFALDSQGFLALFKRKGAKYGASSGVVVILGIAIIVGIATLSNRTRFNKSLDLSRDKLNTLSEQSKQIAKSLRDQKEKISVLAFFSNDQAATEFKDTIYLYQAEGADLQVEYIDPKKDPQRAIAEKIMDLNTVIVRKGSQEKRLTTFTEEKITNAISNVLKERSKKIYFTKGHGESQVKNSEGEGLSTLVTALENDRYQTEEISILETAKIPDDADGVVIISPVYDFKEEETRILDEYLGRGGALFISLPGAQLAPNLVRLSEKFGIKIHDDLLMSPQEFTASGFLPPFSLVMTDFDGLHPITKDFARQSSVDVFALFARSLTINEENPSKLKGTLLAKSSRSSIKVPNIRQKEDIQESALDKAVDGQGSAPLAVAFGKPLHPELAANDGKKDAISDVTDSKKSSSGSPRETRLIVAGAKIAENGLFQYPANRDLVLNSIQYMLQDDSFISIRPKDPTKSTLSITSGTAALSLLLIVWIYPFLFLGAGTFFWLKRRRS
jgi:ABC-type uncharacterized transport system involved in gliding motility auxiliary subunit